ncbi:hypothetical protein EG68_03427 [Paragonimus skrjabini miyazakii]|uniref:Uncharacterized protein n=1 Tax=Paragonimus skrjabini miyazakii TaxID=59628 RepID=A0A8S9Z112_9TREM|nr:hypothetical protein EG68_03427 [Paragonimus skrjabini miyazakii]
MVYLPLASSSSSVSKIVYEISSKGYWLLAYMLLLLLDTTRLTSYQKNVA